MLGQLQPSLHSARIQLRSLLCYRGTRLICLSVISPIRLCKNVLTLQNQTRMLLTGISNQALTYDCHVLLRMECSDMTGMPQFSLCLTPSITPACGDEAVMWNMCDDDATLGLQGSLTWVLCGLPGYEMVHLFDRGFLQILFCFILFENNKSSYQEIRGWSLRPWRHCHLCRLCSAPVSGNNHHLKASQDFKHFNSARVYFCSPKHKRVRPWQWSPPGTS